MEEIGVELYKDDEFWTNDGHQLGRAHHLSHRLQDVDPVLQLYATYVHVVSMDIGDDYYVPTEYIAGRSEDGRVTLTVSMGEVQDLTWTRVPDFIIRGEAHDEALPEKRIS